MKRQICGKSYLLFYLFRDYLISSGVKEEQINFRQQEETHIMENIIYNELIIRGYSVDVGVVEIIENVEGKKRRKQCEIDFVVNMGARRYYIQSALSVSDPDKMGLQTNFCIDATVKSAFERGYKVIVPQGANSTFDNDYMTGEETYKYYNDMMWPKRFATCVSVDEAIKLMES